MAGGKYSGNLVRTWARPEDVPYVGNPDPHHQARDHQADGSDPYPQAHQVPASTGVEYAGTAFPSDVVIGGGFLLDTPSWDDHNGPGDYSAMADDDSYRATIPLAHDGRYDRGFLRRFYAEPVLQSRGTVYGEQVVQGFSPLTGPNQSGAPALLRGINSYAQNNPDREGYVQGVRPGIDRRFVVDVERLQGRRRYNYDAQPLDERRPYVPAQQPADGSMTGSPLPLFRPRSTYQVANGLGVWRDPGNFDDPILAGQSAVDSGVIGGEL